MTQDAIYHELVTRRTPYRRTEGDGMVFMTPNRRAWAPFPMANVPLAPGIQRPSLISSHEGRMEKLLFAFPRWATADSAYSDAYKSVIGAMRKGTRFVIAHHESSKSLIASWFADAGHDPDDITLVPMPDFISMTDWAEDAYVALRDLEDQGHYLMEPWEFLRGGDALVAESVSDYDDIRSAQCPLIFQGGNCLIGDTFWLLGKDYFADTMELLQSSRAPVRISPGTSEEQLSVLTRGLFSQYLDRDREMLLVGTTRAIPVRRYHGRKDGPAFYLDLVGGGMGTFQPIFHIDMFITPVGRGNDGRFRVLVGSPKLGHELSSDGSPYAYDFAFDEIAAGLSSAGMDVIRNPLVHQATEVGASTLERLKEMSQEPGGETLWEAVRELEEGGAKPETPVTVREFHHITWNNCLVESSSGENVVYLPTFGHAGIVHEGTRDEYRYDNEHLANVDEHMRILWQETLGFEPKMLGDFNPFAIRQGVVHCIKKYLKRG